MNYQDQPWLDELARYLESQIPGRNSAKSASEAPPAELVEGLFDRQLALNQAASAVLARRWSPIRSEPVRTLAQIPAIPVAAFKALELTTVPASKRVAAFHSSGTTQHEPSRHYHSQATLGIYRLALEAWFKRRMLGDLPWAWQPRDPEASECPHFISLTPRPDTAPASSLAFMIGTLIDRFGGNASSFHGRAAATGWEINYPAVIEALKRSTDGIRPVIVLGTAFNFVHLLDELERGGNAVALPPGSRVMETGGYKGRSRTVTKPELHDLITARLGVPSRFIVAEYGMSELSSQAFDADFSLDDPERPSRNEGNEKPRISTDCTDKEHLPIRAHPCPSVVNESSRLATRSHCSGTEDATQRVSRSTLSGFRPAGRRLQFPPWCHTAVISPETGREVAPGETGLLRIADLANVASVLAIQTEDLAVQYADGLELLGRATQAEPRGCSLL